jgi:hypothetical protein
MQQIVYGCRENGVTFIWLNKMVGVYDQQLGRGLFKIMKNNFINYVLCIIIIIITLGCEQMTHDSLAISKCINRVYYCDKIKIIIQFIWLFMEHIIIIVVHSKQA